MKDVEIIAFSSVPECWWILKCQDVTFHNLHITYVWGTMRSIFDELDQDPTLLFSICGQGLKGQRNLKWYAENKDMARIRLEHEVELIPLIPMDILILGNYGKEYILELGCAEELFLRALKELFAKWALQKDKVREMLISRQLERLDSFK